MTQTNQQGAPEALFYADALDRCAEVDFDHIFVPSAAVIRRLHAENERLAALVEAQQPATHVQNPSEIEHVAGDVSKNVPESNMAQQPACGNTPYDEGLFTLAQQPAPSAAAAMGDVDLPDAEDMAHSAVQEALSFGLSHDVIHRWMRHIQDQTVKAMLAAPQPSPTPQADSAPTSGNWVSADDVNHLVRELDVALNGEAGAAVQASLCDVVAQVRLESAKRGQPLLAPQADSQPVPVPDVERLDPSQPLHVNLAHLAKSPKAAIEAFGAEWAGWCAASAIDALRAASAPADSAPADSATAPGGEPIAWESTTLGYKKYLTQSDYEMFSPAVRAWYKPYKCSNCTTPPAQAADSVQDLQPVHDAVTIDLLNERVAYLERKLKEADSVLEDAARLDFLCSTDKVRMIECEQKGLWRVYQDEAPPEAVQHHWQAIASDWHTTPRAAIDAAIAARKQGGA